MSKGAKHGRGVRERRPERLREGERRTENTEGTKRGQERAGVRGSRIGKENTTERERESKRDSEIGGGSEARRGEATAGKSRYVRVTSYTRYTCVQRKARVSARVMYVRVDVRMCVCARARVMRA